MKKRNLEGTKRAVTEKNQLLTHVPSRHQTRAEELYHPTGEEFAQGTLFPSHVHAGHIAQMEQFARDQWFLHLQKKKPKRQQDKKTRMQRCYVHTVRDRQSGYKVKILVKKYGLKYIEAFFTLDHQLVTIYPVETNKGAPLTDRGRKIIKSSRRDLQRRRK